MEAECGAGRGVVRYRPNVTSPMPTMGFPEGNLRLNRCAWRGYGPGGGERGVPFLGEGRAASGLVSQLSTSWSRDMRTRTDVRGGIDQLLAGVGDGRGTELFEG